MKRKDVNADTYYEAMLARDFRFDGKFFVGVKTTGIYCRPICPAKPKRENVEFFASRFEAERAGYRPCLRCRPESAPQSPAWIGKSAVVQRAVKMIHSQETIDFHEDEFAARFGVTARHLRRLFVEELGKTPKQLAFENRLNLSRMLVAETSLSLTEIAFASGFSSIRRFNDAFKTRFKKSPSEIRRKPRDASGEVVIHLSYRPPFDFEGLLRTYERHAVGNLEWVEAGVFHRIVAINGKVGTVSVSNVPEKASLQVTIDVPDLSAIPAILNRVRSAFDLNSDPVWVANRLETDPTIRKLLRRYPGIRLPSGWDPFEVAIATILGQLVSVERGRALVADLIEIAGQDTGLVFHEKRIKLFPTPRQIVEADLSALKTTGTRKQTLVAFCQAVLEGKLSLEPTQDVALFMKTALTIRGIGPWSAQYMALKALRDTDAFPSSDLLLARALETHSPQTIEAMRPWRGYVAALFWRNTA